MLFDFQTDSPATSTTPLTSSTKSTIKDMNKTSVTKNTITSTANDTAIPMGYFTGKQNSPRLYSTSRLGNLSCLVFIVFIFIFVCFFIPIPSSLSSLSQPVKESESEAPAAQSEGHEKPFSPPLTQEVYPPGDNIAPPDGDDQDQSNQPSKQSDDAQEQVQPQTSLQNDEKLNDSRDQDHVVPQELPPAGNESPTERSNEAQGNESGGATTSSTDIEHSETGDMDEVVSTSESSPPAGMRQCGHVILFSAPRHGSTWFLDCVENCTFTMSNDGTFGKLNEMTELWNHGQKGPVDHISLDGAIDYVQRNISVKLFPFPLKLNEDNATRLIEQSSRNGISLVVLTRRYTEAYRSHLEARESMEWNTNLAASKNKSGEEDHDMNTSVRTVVDGEGRPVDVSDGKSGDNQPEEFMSLDVYKEFLHWHFVRAYQILDNLSLLYDVLDYDVVRKQKWIVLSKQNCYVYNCNFNLLR